MRVDSSTKSSVCCCLGGANQKSRALEFGVQSLEHILRIIRNCVKWITRTHCKVLLGYTSANTLKPGLDFASIASKDDLFGRRDAFSDSSKDVRQLGDVI